jgi:hypothetical protein
VVLWDQKSKRWRNDFGTETWSGVWSERNDGYLDNKDGGIRDAREMREVEEEVVEVIVTPVKAWRRR